MGLDKRYPAFLLILVIFLGFFLLNSTTFRKEPPAEAPEAVTGAKGTAPEALSLKAVQSSLPVFPIDLNKATVHELTLLPGIGEKTARRIIEKRAELNGFRSVEDLTGVKWIGKAKLDKIRGLVSAGPEPK